MTNEDLWVKYWRTRDQDVRQQLIISYLWLVKQLAGRLVVKLPAYFSREDLENSGILGLIEAVDKFNPEKGCSFETYAYNRVRGAMIDSLRKLNWVPRTLWSKLQKVNAARGKLEKEKGGAVTDQQLAGEMGISLKELHNICAHFSRVTIASLDEVLISSEGDQMHLRGFVEDPTVPDPLDIIEIKENREKLIQAIENLPEKEIGRASCRERV